MIWLALVVVICFAVAVRFAFIEREYLRRKRELDEIARRWFNR